MTEGSRWNSRLARGLKEVSGERTELQRPEEQRIFKRKSIVNSFGCYLQKRSSNMVTGRYPLAVSIQEAVTYP